MDEEQQELDFEEMAAGEIPPDEVLRKVSELAVKQVRLMRLVVMLQTELKEHEAELREVSMVQLPELLRDHGMLSIRLENGMSIRVQHNVKATIPAAKRALAHEWLRNNGFGSLIKPKVIEEQVHPQTLSAFCREQLEAGRSFPESFSVYEYDVTVIKQ